MVRLDRRSCVIVVINLFFISFIFENERCPLLFDSINTKYIRREMSTFGKVNFKLSSQSILNKNNSHDSSFLQSLWSKLTKLLNCINSFPNLQNIYILARFVADNNKSEVNIFPNLLKNPNRLHIIS